MKTEDIMGALSGGADFDKVEHEMKGEFTESSLALYLDRLLEKYGVTRPELIERANIERSYAYQIFNGRRMPSRDRLIQLAMGIGATLEDTQKLLKFGGRNELYPRVRRDAAIIFCINKGYSLMDCQIFLEEHGFEPVKE